MNELNTLNASVIFTNWTNEDFSHTWGGVMYHFPARSSQTISVGTIDHNEGIAKFFAKHLTDRELNKRNIPTDHFSRGEFERNCFVPTDKTEDVPVMEVEVHADTGLIKAVKEVARENPTTGVRSKKAEKKIEIIEQETQQEQPKAKEKKPKVNDEFED